MDAGYEAESEGGASELHAPGMQAAQIVRQIAPASPHNLAHLQTSNNANSRPEMPTNVSDPQLTTPLPITV
jgi:hypothetical protein